MPITQLGRYKITGTLGRGAMGVVYKAYDPLIDRMVAIKTVDHASLSREEAEGFERRFNREAKSAGRLNHPNIVTIHDVGRNDDLSYIAMEFLVGRSLREILDSGHELSLLRIAEIAAQVADGLAFAHINDVVHRDIKPANIMVLDNDVVKITDFGVALLPTGGHSLDGAACGSPKYMAPEQITGEKVDGRSDIFSLGAVLYEMLAGRPAFAGDDLGAILYQVLNEAPPLPSEYYPSLPNGFDRIVARAMAKNPEKRYQNAAEMSADLRKYRRYAKEAKKRQLAEQEAARAHESEHKPEGGNLAPPVVVSVNATASEKPVGRGRVLRIAVPLVSVALIAGGVLIWRGNQVPEDATLSSTTESVATTAPLIPAANVAAEDVAAAHEAPAQAESSAAPAETTPSEPSGQSMQPAAEPSASDTAAPSKPDVVPPVALDAKVRLAITPWGEVYVDNRKVGVSPPLTEVKLPPGKHVVEVRNGSFEPYKQQVNLAANASFRIKHKFE